MTAIESVAICVASYRRPESLGHLLRSLEGLTAAFSWRVIVVDNDPAGSAADVVRASSLRDRIEYAIEPNPGIPAARNRCLDLVREDDDAIAFVDDDELVDADWLSELVAAAMRFRVGVVAGPVISDFPSRTPRWMRGEGVIQAPIRPTGSAEGSPFTNNSLVTATVLRDGGVRFGEVEFRDSGGSDRDFFDRLLGAGDVPWVWCAEAVVHEPVPRERTTSRWIWRRGLRTGNVTGRMRLRYQSAATVLTAGLFRMAIGMPAAIVLWPLRPGLAGRALVGSAQGIGMAWAAMGRRIREYQRAE
jgi:glycosyltransferase involved in cell wall biosynthesis